MLRTAYTITRMTIGEKGHRGMPFLAATSDSDKHVELLQLEKSGIRVAEYVKNLLPREQLEKKLHEAIRTARAQLAARQPPLADMP